MQKDIINQVHKNSHLHGSDPKMVQRMMDYQQVCKEGGFKSEAVVRQKR